MAEIKCLNASNTLANLMTSCNRNCYCSVKCPWGCSEFPDECGFAGFYKFLFFKFKNIKMPVAESSMCDSHIVGESLFRGFVGIVPDYLEYNKIGILDDSHWPVRPSIRFVPGRGPMLCTCKRHSIGSSQQYLHPPRNPLNKTMPSSRGDPISHVVMAPCTLQTIKTNNKYSTTFQMQSCNGGFSGIDSCDVKEVGVFDKCNIISQNNATLALHFRLDIVGKLRQMVETKVVPQIYEDSLYIDLAKEQFHRKQALLKEGTQRGTRINLGDALKAAYNEDKLSKLPFVPSWPMILAKCHLTETAHGPMPPTAPSMKLSKHNLRQLYYMLSMATSVPMLWEGIANSVNFDGLVSWHGFFLSYATKHMLEGYSMQNRGKKKKDPYYCHNLEPTQLTWKMCSGNTTAPAPSEYSPIFELKQLTTVLGSVKKCCCQVDG